MTCTSSVPAEASVLLSPCPARLVSLPPRPEAHQPWSYLHTHPEPLPSLPGTLHAPQQHGPVLPRRPLERLRSWGLPHQWRGPGQAGWEGPGDRGLSCCCHRAGGLILWEPHPWLQDNQMGWGPQVPGCGAGSGPSLCSHPAHQFSAAPAPGAGLRVHFTRRI